MIAALEDDPTVRALARASLAGLGPIFLAARDEDDIAVLVAASNVAVDERESEARFLAHQIAEGTRKVLGG